MLRFRVPRFLRLNDDANGPRPHVGAYHGANLSYDDIAILLDVPGDGTYVYINVRLAGVGTSPYRGLFYKGVDCYLL